MTSGGQQERYTMGYGKAHDLMEERTSNFQAGFFVPHIRSGMKLLDCGSGPGSITLGLAGIVSPGEVIGIDIADSQVERASALAENSDVNNVRFEAASVYELPFPNESFDAVFANAVLEHLEDPLKALSEMKRVLRTGGVVGVRDTSQGNHVYPEILQKYLTVVQQLWKHNGGNPFIGRDLKSLLVQSGFVSTAGSATFECFGTPEQAHFYASTHRSLIRETNGSHMIELGFADRSDIESFIDAFEEWEKQPDAFAAICYCEAVGWKERNSGL